MTPRQADFFISSHGFSLHADFADYADFFLFLHTDFLFTQISLITQIFSVHADFADYADFFIKRLVSEICEICVKRKNKNKRNQREKKNKNKRNLCEKKNKNKRNQREKKKST